MDGGGPKEARKGCLDPQELELTGGSELPHGCQELSLDPQKEHPVLLTTNPSLQHENYTSYYTISVKIPEGSFLKGKSYKRQLLAQKRPIRSIGRWTTSYYTPRHFQKPPRQGQLPCKFTDQPHHCKLYHVKASPGFEDCALSVSALSPFGEPSLNPSLWHMLKFLFKNVYSIFLCYELFVLYLGNKGFWGFAAAALQSKFFI